MDLLGRDEVVVSDCCPQKVPMKWFQSRHCFPSGNIHINSGNQPDEMCPDARNIQE
jgi:hypothetical protein